MTVGELRAFLAQSTLPDDAEVLITGKHCFRTARAEEATVSEVNPYGQAQSQPDGDSALLFIDTSS